MQCVYQGYSSGQYRHSMKYVEAGHVAGRVHAQARVVLERGGRTLGRCVAWRTRRVVPCRGRTAPYAASSSRTYRIEPTTITMLNGLSRRKKQVKSSFYYSIYYKSSFPGLFWLGHTYYFREREGREQARCFC